MESLSRPAHRRKHSATANVFSSFSSNSPYDDFLLSSGGGQVSVGTKLGAQEYAEIFSGSQRGSSIPVLDLSGLEERTGSGDFRSSKLDYSNIFGGFRDEDVAVPYEKLFARGKTRKHSSDKQGTPSNAGSPLPESDSLNPSGKNKGFSVEAPNQYIDSTKQQLNMSFNRTDQRSNDGSSGKMHIAQLHAVSGFAYFVDGTAHVHKTEDNRPVPSMKREVSRAWSFSADVEEKHGRKSETHIPDIQIASGAVRSKGVASWDESDATDKLLNAKKINLKSNHSEVLPSSRPSNPNDQKGPRRTRSTSFGSKADASEKITGDSSPPFSDEELDANSVAAASAAALKKAIEQAQESIRIAKEIMERRRECFRDGSKPSTRGCWKVKDKKHNRIDHEVNSSKENNVAETYKNSDPVWLTMTELDRKFDASLGQRETIHVAGKVEVEKLQKNVEITEEHAMAMSFSRLETHADSRTATSGYVQVDNNNNLVPAMNELVSDIKGIEKVKKTLDRTEVVFDHSEGPSNVAEVCNPESFLVTSQRVQELEEIVDGENLRINQDDEGTEVKQNVFDENGKCTKKFEGHQEIVNGEQLKLQKLVFDHALEEPQNLAKQKKDQEEALRQELMEKKLESIPKWKENGDHAGKSYPEDEIELRPKEAHLLFETEGPKEALEKEINDKEQKVFPEAEEVEQRLDGVNELEIDDKKLNCDHDVERVKIPGEHECEAIEERYAETSKYETAETVQMKASICAQDRKIAVAPEVEDSNRKLSGKGIIEDNHAMFDFQEVVHEKHNDTAVDAYGSDTSTTLSETLEACTVELNNHNAAKNQQAVKSYEEKVGISRVNETSFTLAKNEEKDPVEKAFVQNNEVPETGFLSRSASEENFVTSELHNAFEALFSDGNTEKFSNTDANCGPNLQQDEYAFETADHCNVAQENANEYNMQDFPELHTSDEKTIDLDITDVDFVMWQTSDSEKGSESISNLEDMDELPVHDSQACAENVRDQTSSNEAVDEMKYVELDQSEGVSSLLSEPKQNEESVETERELETDQNIDNNMENLKRISAMEEEDAKETVLQKLEKKDHLQQIEAIKREREREKERIAVERAIREARERAFVEARERAERAAVERAAAEVRQRVMAEARDKLEKASAATKQSADKATAESKLRTERAAVERATAEARERALEKAFSQKTPNEARAQAERYPTDKFSGASRNNALKHSYSSSDLEKFDGNNNESAQRRKARLERHQRIMERAAKALAEKNMRDLLAQKEQAERNRLAESLDADIKRWAAGKEGNLRALLSTLQYILGSDSGWQPISLTEIITTAAVKKAYRKATLYVHPDKLQQKGASIQQKYICEKVFDLLKAAWNSFNSEER